MSGTREIRIDRLVLDIPGFDPGKAGALTREIAQHLAGADINGDQARMSRPMTLQLSPNEADAPDLALRIARLLMQRLSR